MQLVERNSWDPAAQETDFILAHFLGECTEEMVEFKKVELHKKIGKELSIGGSQSFIDTPVKLSRTLFFTSLS